MEHYLSPEKIRQLKEELSRAEPYPTDNAAPLSFDGEVDFDRECATMAKLLLDMYYAEKGWERESNCRYQRGFGAGDAGRADSPKGR